MLDDTANPRVQAHAAAALVNFSDDCPKNILSMYLDNILAKLETVLSTRMRDGTYLYKCLLLNFFLFTNTPFCQLLFWKEILTSCQNCQCVVFLVVFK